MVRVSATANSFQLNTNVRMPVAARPGVMMGTTTSHSTGDAPVSELSANEALTLLTANQPKPDVIVIHRTDGGNQSNWFPPIGSTLDAFILDPDHAPKRVDAALGGLAVAPELFDTPSPVHLGLRQAKVALDDARTDADLLDVAALLWTMALKIEDGDATQAQRDLRAAEQKLREALKNGASDEEIRKLMEQLREAARRFMSELARNSQDANPEDQNLQAQDLDKLLNQMEDTARNGSREDAQAMLDQMQEMFENMRGAREGVWRPVLCLLALRICRRVRDCLRAGLHLWRLRRLRMVRRLWLVGL